MFNALNHISLNQAQERKGTNHRGTAAVLFPFLQSGSLLSCSIPLLLSGCFDPAPPEKTIAELRWNDSTCIELKYIPAENRQRNLIQVWKKDVKNGCVYLVDIIDGYDDHFKINLAKQNDSVLNIGFSDPLRDGTGSKVYGVNTRMVDTSFNNR
jgi:hypothetical protein